MMFAARLGLPTSTKLTIERKWAPLMAKKRIMHLWRKTQTLFDLFFHFFVFAGQGGNKIVWLHHAVPSPILFQFITIVSWIDEHDNKNDDYEPLLCIRKKGPLYVTVGEYFWHPSTYSAYRIWKRSLRPRRVDLNIWTCKLSLVRGRIRIGDIKSYAHVSHPKCHKTNCHFSLCRMLKCRATDTIIAKNLASNYSSID